MFSILLHKMKIYERLQSQIVRILQAYSVKCFRTNNNWKKNENIKHSKNTQIKIF